MKKLFFLSLSNIMIYYIYNINIDKFFSRNGREGEEVRKRKT